MMKPHNYTIVSKAAQHADKQGKVVKLLCKHREQWPPAEAYLPDSPERLRAKEIITETGYQSLQVWERECGKKKMDDACSTCPHARTMARVKARGTGRITPKEIEFAAFMQTSRQDVFLKFERVEPVAVPETSPEEVTSQIEVPSEPDLSETPNEDNTADGSEDDGKTGAESIAAEEDKRILDEVKKAADEDDEDEGDLSAFLDGID